MSKKYGLKDLIYNLGIEEAPPEVTPPFPTQKSFSLSAEIHVNILQKYCLKF